MIKGSDLVDQMVELGLGVKAVPMVKEELDEDFFADLGPNTCLRLGHVILSAAKNLVAGWGITVNQFYVYIASSHRRTLYTGVTNDLARRMYEHRHKLVE